MKSSGQVLFYLVAIFSLSAAAFAASAPNVILSHPDDGASFTAPASIQLDASAASPDGVIASVSFYSGSALLGTVKAAPYSFTWSNVPVGQYFLSAVTTDGSGNSATSNIVHVNVVAHEYSVASRASNVNVVTQRYDNARTGLNAAETTLTTANVTAQQFGKLFSRTVDGQVYAQPLYVSNLNLGANGIHNVVIVATEHNTVYAFDADDPGSPAPLWQVSLGTPASSADVLCGRLQPEIGVTSTPVIDVAGHTIYVVNKSKVGSTLFNSIHALDLLTGNEKFGGPTVVSATVAGTGDGSSGGSIAFDAVHQFDQAALLLSNGVVYATFGGHCDLHPFHGWVISYDAQTLARRSVSNLTPAGGGGGVSQCGNGPSADANGQIFLMTGSGTFDANSGGSSYANSYLNLSSTLSVQSYFTPHDVAALNANDLDVGAGGPLLIPNSTLLAGAGKTGTLYVLNRASLGGFDPNTDHVVQQISGVNGGGDNNPSLAYWNGPGGPYVYMWSGQDVLKAYKFTGSALQSTPASQNSIQQSVPTGAISVSANGSTAATGIVWGVHSQNGTGVLHAFDAQNVANELWNSEQNSARDSHGSFASFAVPTVANGKVYAANFSNQLDVYGLLPAGLSVNITSPSSGSVFGSPASINFTVQTLDQAATVTRVDYYNGATLIGSSTATPFSFTWGNVGAGNYSIHATATDSANSTATSAAVALTVSASGGALPAPWQDQDVGGVAIAGSASYGSGAFTVKASGSDMWGGQDEYHLVYQPFNGDGQITARVATVQNTNSWAKAGVIITERPIDDSVYAFCGVTPGSGSIFQRRTATGIGDVGTGGPGVTAPYWVRVVRKGSTFTGFVSSNGSTWVQVSSDTISMNTNAYAGLALCSHDNSQLNTGTFDSVSVQPATGGNQPPTVSLTGPADGATATAPATISLNATAVDSDGTIARVDFYNGGTLLGSATASPYQFTWSNVAAGTYTLTAVATDNGGATTTSNAARITVNASGGGGALPAPWSDGDIGSVGSAGSAAYSGGVFTIKASGADIWGSFDSFNFVSQPLTGDMTITARVTAVQPTDGWAKAGVMIRQSLTANSPHAMMAVSSGNGAAFQRRPQADSVTSHTGASGAAPDWVRLVRRGNIITASQSSDGSTWTQVDSDTIVMSGTVYAGLCVCAHNNSALNTTTVSSVTITTP